MAPSFRKKEMNAARCGAAFLAAVLSWTSLPAQKPPHFYNVDTEIRLEGSVLDVILETRYVGNAPFLVVVLEESRTKLRYKVEMGPSWFFAKDVHKGEKIEIVGSLSEKEGETKGVIARQVRYGGETFMLRDTMGFPNWRGGAMKQRGRRRGRGI